MRAAANARDSQNNLLSQKPQVQIKKYVKIGRPGYKITKQQDPASKQHSLLIQVEYPEIRSDGIPRYRFMSAYEQKVDTPNKDWQYVVFSAEPYENIAFKIPSREIDRNSQTYWSQWNKETNTFYLQFS